MIPRREITLTILLIAVQTVTALLLGIVFLMTNKPSLTGALLVMAIALGLGLASGLLVARTTRAGQQSIAAEADRTRKPAV